jgi:hypothetical protein
MSSATETTFADPARRLLRHTVATLAYRGEKVLRGSPDSFAAFRALQQSRSPADILAHIGDLLEWGLSMAQGAQRWHNSTSLPWAEERQRFFSALAALDEYLASSEPLAVPAEKLFQGPIADALTHVGQLALLRRLAGFPIRGENYFVANIEAGRVGPEQAAPIREFD